MLNEIDITRDVSTRLSGAGIPFMLTGSLAMNYYAQPRMTRDIDFVVELEAHQANVMAVLFGADYYVSYEAIVGAITQQTMFNLIHNESVIKVDCVVRQDTEYRRVEFERRQQVAVQGFDTFIVTREDLILSKLVWARSSRSEKQLGDVRNLLTGDCDADYLTPWAASLGVETLLEECLNG